MRRATSLAPFQGSTGETRPRTIVMIALKAVLLNGLIPVCFLSSISVAADQRTACGLDRWALISSAQVQDSGTADLLTARLSAVAGIELVERDRLDEVLREFERSPLSKELQASSRVHLGQLLGADALLLLTMAKGQRDEFLRIVVCDCRQGARLRTEHLPRGDVEPEVLVEQVVSMVRDVRQHYSDGVTTILGVSPFVSKNLVHNYDYLQTGFSHLLQETLARSPGVAVIEVEEARAIRRELALGGEHRVQRLVPVLVEADFTAKAASSEDPSQIAIEIRMLQSEDAPRIFRSPELTLAQAVGYLTTDVPQDLLEAATRGKVTPVPVQQQSSWLIERADTFARLGAWEHAIGLREAALLLRPEDTDLRLQLVGEYRRQVTRRIGAVQELQQWKLDHPLIREEIQQRVDAYLAGLGHLEYLIRNRRIPAMRAVELADRYRTHCFLHAIPFSTGTVDGEYRRVGQIELKQAEDAQSHFLFEVLPLIPDLPDDDVPKHRFGRPYMLHAWQRVVAEIALLQVDRTYRTKEDLDFVYRSLTEVIPDGLETQLSFEQFLSADGRRYRSLPRGVETFSEEDWLAFLRRLEDSEHEVARLYGRYGQIHKQWRSRKPLSLAQLRELHEDVESFLADFAATQYNPPWNYGRTREWMYGRAKDIRTYVTRDIRQMTSEPDSQLANRPPIAPRKPDDRRSLGRLRFDPVALQVRDQSGKVSSARGKRWRGAGGWSGFTRMIQCGPDLDVYWQNGAILFMREEGILDEVFIDSEPNFEQVVWDGESVWIATRQQGIWVVDPDGKLRTRVTAEQGLPPANHGVMIHPVAKGQVFAVGSFGEHQRAWCAMIDCRQRAQPAVQVFHEATRVVQTDEPSQDLSEDPSLCFKPYWIHTYRVSNSSLGSQLLVGRRTPNFPQKTDPFGGINRPLLVNLDTHEVTVFGIDLTMADYRNSESYFSRNGFLLEAGNNGVTLRPPTGGKLAHGKQRQELCEDRADRDIIGHQGGFAMKLLPHQGWLYAPGGTWWRINPRTFESERLVPWRLPQDLESLRRFGVSAHYGLIAWGDEFYRVRDASEVGSVHQ